MKNLRLTLILVMTVLLSLAPLTAAAEEMPDKLSDLHQIPKTKWEVGDFGYHIDSQGESTYGPLNVVDGLLETAWVTKDNPSSILGDMMIGFKSLAEDTISEFSIRNGYCKSVEIWEKNSRVKKMAVFIDKKRVVTVTLKDTMEEQIFSLSKDYSLKAGDVISFLILETYPGSKYTDVAISELHLDYDTGVSNDKEGDLEVRKVKWKFKTGDLIYDSPTVSDDVVYFGSWDGNLYAVDINIGQELWRFETGDHANSPRVVEGVVYFDGGNDKFYAADVKEGKELWRFGMEGKERMSLSPSVIGDVVYLVGGDPWKYGVVKKDKLYALDKNSGQELWRFKTEGRIRTSPSVVDGVVYFQSGKNIHAVDKNTGQGLWCFKTENWVVGSPCVVDGVVYFGNYDGNFYAVDTNTGQELWRFTTGNSVDTSPAIVDGVVYFGNDDGIFYAVDKKNGQELWRFKAEEHGSIKSSPALIGSVVYFVSGVSDNFFDNKLHALDIKTGQELWWIHSSSSESCIIDSVFYIAGERHGIGAVDINTGKNLWFFATEGYSCSNPVVVDGVVYFGCEDGYFYALE